MSWSELLKSMPRLLIIVIVFAIILGMLILVFQVKVVTGLCKLVGSIIHAGTEYTGLFSGVGLRAFIEGCELIGY